MNYTIACHDCPSTSESDWFGNAVSDADWHNTATGHDAYVVKGDAIVYDLAEVTS